MSASGGGSVVVKAAGTGVNAYDGGTPGPVEEAVAAQLGGIADLGVMTARTVPVETAGAEGQLILAQLAKLAPPADALLAELRGTELFLVMQRAPGERADKAARIVAGSSPAERMRMFYGLGRLWAFAVLINSTDRFVIGNWGNVILGRGGSVVGIDQMVGAMASNIGIEYGRDEARSALKTALDAGTRRAWARRMFADISKTWGPAAAAFEGEFVLQFELGALEGLAAVAAMKPLELDATKAQMPTFVQATVHKMGLGGAAIIQQAFHDARDEIGDRLGKLRDEIGARELISGPVRAKLAVPRKFRDELLGRLSEQAGALVGEWSEINKWYTGKDRHWSAQGTKLIERVQPDFRTFAETAASFAEGDPTLLLQVEDWEKGLREIWAIVAGAGKLEHGTVKAWVEKLRAAVQRELGRVPLAEQVA